MRLFENPSFDFIRGQQVAYVFSGLLILISLIAIIGKGLQYGIDFTGGLQFVVEFEEPVEVLEVREALTEPLGSQPDVKRYGSPSEILVRSDTDKSTTEVENLFLSALGDLYPDNPATIIKTDVVGPRFAEDLKRGAFKAIIFALIAIFLYILIRFKNWQYSVGAVTALFHDVIITLGIFTLLSEVMPFNMRIDQAIIAAFLTIVGYSINDTVVVFDRIRENSLTYKTLEFKEMINQSLNDTLSRTVITSVTTFFVIAVLFTFGGEVLRGFSFVLLIGIFLGTYSSLYIASAVVVELGESKS